MARARCRCPRNHVLLSGWEDRTVCVLRVSTSLQVAIGGCMKILLGTFLRTIQGSKRAEANFPASHAGQGMRFDS